MNWLVGNFVDVYPLEGDASQSVLSGYIVKANKKGLLMIRNNGTKSQVTWETLEGYQVTTTEDSVKSDKVFQDAYRVVQSLKDGN